MNTAVLLQEVLLLWAVRISVFLSEGCRIWKFWNQKHFLSSIINSLFFFMVVEGSDLQWYSIMQVKLCQSASLSLFGSEIYIAKMEFCSPAQVTCAYCIKGLVFWQKACAAQIVSDCRWYPFESSCQKFFSGNGRTGGRRIKDNRGIPKDRRC